MKASLIQRQIKQNEQTLTSLYREQSNYRKSRAKFNERADAFERYAHNAATRMEAEDAIKEAEANYEQAALFTPFIKRLKRKITALEVVQKALKHELQCVACLEAFVAEDDAFWLEQAKVAQEEGFAEPGVVQAFLDDGWE